MVGIEFKNKRRNSSTARNKRQKAATRAKFLVVRKTATHSKSLSDRRFVKQCVEDVT
jgi:hypothetical protein